MILKEKKVIVDGLYLDPVIPVQPLLKLMVNITKLMRALVLRTGSLRYRIIMTRFRNGK